MQHLLRAILVGFGQKLGAELALLFADRVGISKRKRKPSVEDTKPAERDLEDEPEVPEEPTPAATASEE